MNEHPTPHDALFKAVFSEPENAFALLRTAFAPELGAAIDPSSLRLQPASFVDEELREVHRDLLFTAKLAGKEALLYVLLEHQSTVGPLMPFRLLRYMRVWEAWLREHPRATTLPAVLPLVLHQGPKPWSAAVRLSDLVTFPAGLLEAARRHMPELVLTLHDLGSAPEVRDVPPVVRLTIDLMRAAAHRGDPAATLENSARLVRELLSDPRGRVRLTLLVRYTVLVSKRNVSKVASDQRAPVTEEARVQAEMVRVFDDLLIQQGRRQIFEQVLRRRFGDLDETTRARLDAATPKDLELWTDRILDAKTLAQVFEPKKPRRRRPRAR